MSVLNYKNINDLFLCIKDDEYVVLRNFEELFKNDFLSMHPDIDFLCKDKKRLIYN